MKATLTSRGTPVAALLQDVAYGLDGTFNDLTRPDDRNVGFALLVFPLNGGGRFDYVGNCSRESMLAALKEVVARWEAAARGGEGHA